MRALDINTESWEDLAADRGSWRNTLHKQLKLGEEKLIAAAAEQRARRKERTTDQRPHADATSATEAATLGLFSTVTRDVAQADSLGNKLWTVELPMVDTD